LSCCSSIVLGNILFSCIALFSPLSWFVPSWTEEPKIHRVRPTVKGLRSIHEYRRRRPPCRKVFLAAPRGRFIYEILVQRVVESKPLSRAAARVYGHDIGCAWRVERRSIGAARSGGPKTVAVAMGTRPVDAAARLETG